MQDTAAVDTYLPRFLHRYPTATIHYRWPQSPEPPPTDEKDVAPAPSSSSKPSQQPRPPTLPQWPTPIHDVLAAYDYLVRTLTPPPKPPPSLYHQPRRDIFVYGRHLGGGLAASLAITECHTRAPMAVRGLLAVNGVYNWTTFLPDHPVNTTRAALKRALFGAAALLVAKRGSGGDLDDMEALLPRLFHRPGDLFDPFASPLLFFHTAGLMVPPSFTARWQPDYQTAKYVPSPLAAPNSSGEIDLHDYVYSDPEDPLPPTSSAGPSSRKSFIAPPARKGYMTFPPRGVALTIPDTLLMHNASPPPVLPISMMPRPVQAWRTRFRNAENSFGSQAVGLAGLMRRSVWKMQAKKRVQWDEEVEDYDGQAARHVETGEISVGEDGVEDEDEVQEMARQWFEDHLG